MYLGWHREQQANVAKQLRDLEPSTTACRLPPLSASLTRKGEKHSRWRSWARFANSPGHLPPFTLLSPCATNLI